MENSIRTALNVIVKNILLKVNEIRYRTCNNKILLKLKT